MAIFGIVVLGNMGLPLPEEGVLLLAGYLVWAGKLGFAEVVIIGIVSAVLGDSLGYWFGRRYGQPAILRYGHMLFLTEARLIKATAFVKRYGSYGVFFANRFSFKDVVVGPDAEIAAIETGLRFMAGPLAGCTGMEYSRFFAANLTGGIIYAPVCVAIGYLLGRGFGNSLQRLESIIGKVEHYALALLGLSAVIIGVWRWFGSRKFPTSNGKN